MRRSYKITLPEELMQEVQLVPAERGVTRDDILEMLLRMALRMLYSRKGTRRIRKPNPYLRVMKEGETEQ